MFGKLAGLITVFDMSGEKLAQATMIRYLNEIMWFPGRIFIDDAGRLTNFTAMRYREIDGDFSLDPWSTPIVGYGERAGLNLPVRGQAVWNLPSGDLPYADLEITDLEYNSAA
jgi:hypothetical protein